MPKRQEVKNAPGFYYEYQAGHGFSAKHAYNPRTNEALSWRQAAAVRDGKKSVEQALFDQAKPLLSRTTSNVSGWWLVTLFRALSAAYHYATTQTTNPSYFVVYGVVRHPYEGESKVSYRAITTLAKPRAILRKWSLDELWDRVSDVIETDSRTRYIVWEREDR